MKILIRIQLGLSLIILVLSLLATGVRANQEDGAGYERWTLKPDVPLHFDANTVAIIVRKVQVLRHLTNYDIVILEVETVDSNGKHIIKTYEKSLEGGHDSYWEMLTEDMKVKGKITKEPTR